MLKHAGLLLIFVDNFFCGNRKLNMIEWLTMKKMDICSIINAKSGRCGEDCKFCAQSARHDTDVSTYSLKNTGEIVDAARSAKEIGAQRFGIVTSGNRLTQKELEAIREAISRIKRDLGMDVCASLGALSKDELTLLKCAGLSRYHHNIETSPRFYPQVVTTHTFQERVDTIKAAKEVGFEVCSGGIIGMGETWDDRREMANILRELDVDSVPINILIPIKGTPFENLDMISPEDVIKTIALFREILKEDKTIKIAAGREAMPDDSQIDAFLAGANGMLISGYLTIKGRPVEEDQKLIKEIENKWAE